MKISGFIFLSFHFFFFHVVSAVFEYTGLDIVSIEVPEEPAFDSIILHLKGLELLDNGNVASALDIAEASISCSGGMSMNFFGDISDLSISANAGFNTTIDTLIVSGDNRQLLQFFQKLDLIIPISQSHPKSKVFSVTLAIEHAQREDPSEVEEFEVYFQVTNKVSTSFSSLEIGLSFGLICTFLTIFIALTLTFKNSRKKPRSHSIDTNASEEVYELLQRDLLLAMQKDLSRRDRRNSMGDSHQVKLEARKFRNLDHYQSQTPELPDHEHEEVDDDVKALEIFRDYWVSQPSSPESKVPSSSTKYSRASTMGSTMPGGRKLSYVTGVLSSHDGSRSRRPDLESETVPSNESPTTPAFNITKPSLQRNADDATIRKRKPPKSGFLRRSIPNRPVQRVGYRPMAMPGEATGRQRRMAFDAGDTSGVNQMAND